jgi:hypothetical protein
VPLFEQKPLKAERCMPAAARTAAAALAVPMASLLSHKQVEGGIQLIEILISQYAGHP